MRSPCQRQLRDPAPAGETRTRHRRHAV